MSSMDMIVKRALRVLAGAKNMMRDNNKFPDLWYGEYYDEKKEESEYYQQVMNEHEKSI